MAQHNILHLTPRIIEKDLFREYYMDFHLHPQYYLFSNLYFGINNPSPAIVPEILKINRLQIHTVKTKTELP